MQAFSMYISTMNLSVQHIQHQPCAGTKAPRVAVLRGDCFHLAMNVY